MKQIPLVLATHNKGKSQEIKTLLKDSPLLIKDLNDFGPIPPIVEDGATFDDNAYKKASFTARVLGLPALADDSGLVVHALDGAPGVYSARYAGENATDEQNCIKLMAQMKDVSNRKASFICVVSIAIPTGPALTYEAQCDGAISENPAGKSGFGYDPIFFYPPKNKTFAELSAEEKMQSVIVAKYFEKSTLKSTKS
ncbi:MAG: nucleoside-triphosphatase [Candidatus Magnetoglobus multicellularis str. Araruama]|uniref:dITP/XTP pyrophosphatase n=1 Tax=Candidatus Magnetoglobus multicellularis str. Araruama TaxID=890399 RepID=A0A1V1NV81_9BACT|nr:MAG: nucleoside-triphosphatase [Candidatus Magnetoglobus multicellularis str. Araruama]